MTDEAPVEYRLEHLLQQLAEDPDVAETDVVLEHFGDVLVVSANVASDARRLALLAAVRARWDGDVRDQIDVLSHLTDTERPTP
jgi:hypothetical protein